MALLHQPRGWQDDRAGVTPRTKEMTALWLLMIVLVALIIVVPLVWLLTRTPDKPADPPPVAAKTIDPPAVDPRAAEMEAKLHKAEAARADLEKNLNDQIETIAALKSKPAVAPVDGGDKVSADQLKALQAKLDKAVADFNAADLERKTEKTRADSLDAQVKRLEETLAKGAPSDNNLAVRVANLERELAQNQAALTIKEGERQRLADQVTTLNTQITQLTTKGTGADAQLQALQAQVTKLTADVAARDANVAQLTGTVTKLNGDVADRDRTIQLLRDRLHPLPPPPCGVPGGIRPKLVPVDPAVRLAPVPE
jgi:hypothetical protein